MTKRSAADPPSYDASVFINCPFSADYAAIFRAYVFAVMYCGLRPRCAREADNAGEVRFEKIIRIMRGCRWSIHDLSMTGVDHVSGHARFNMPFELGLFLGAQRFGGGAQRDKQCLILEAEAFTTQRCLSDVAGQDCKAHNMSPEIVVGEVRDWLRTALSVAAPSRGAAIDRFLGFESDLGSFCDEMGVQKDHLLFVDLCQIIKTVLAVET